jgi:hypothetical protein
MMDDEMTLVLLEPTDLMAKQLVGRCRSSVWLWPCLVKGREREGEERRDRRRGRGSEWVVQLKVGGGWGGRGKASKLSVKKVLFDTL